MPPLPKVSATLYQVLTATAWLASMVPPIAVLVPEAPSWATNLPWSSPMESGVSWAPFDDFEKMVCSPDSVEALNQNDTVPFGSSNAALLAMPI
jgi:hypothetical protein